MAGLAIMFFGRNNYSDKPDGPDQPNNGLLMLAEFLSIQLRPTQSPK
jgi:hypothetical protein